MVTLQDICSSIVYKDIRAEFLKSCFQIPSNKNQILEEKLEKRERFVMIVFL